MTDEARELFNKYRNLYGRMITETLETQYDEVKRLYGKDFATGYVFGLDTAHVIVTGKTMQELKEQEEEG